ncbi:hypothetical protein ACA910_017781 [Epithemia clementina (nom. ined.)]
MYRNMNNPIVHDRPYPTDLSVVSASARNVTDESCSDPSMGEPDTSSALQRPTRKRSSHRSLNQISTDPDNEDVAVGSGKKIEEIEFEPNTTTSMPEETFSIDENFEVLLTWQRNNRVLLRRLEEISTRGKLSMINLTRRGIGHKEAVLLHQAMMLNPSLSVLKLSYNNLGDAGASIIARGFMQNGKHHDKLSILDMGFNDIGDSGCEAIALMAIAGNLNISGVYLSGNRIGEKGALAIAGAILHGSGISALHLSANKIGSRGIKAVVGAVAKHDATVFDLIQQQPHHQQGNNSSVTPRTVTELHIGGTGIDTTGFIAVPGMALSNTSMKVLCLSNNNINDNDILMLSQALSQNKSIPLEKLELSFNEISDQGVECLMNAVWGSPHMRVLKLDNNKLQDRGAQLCAVVLTSIELEVLDLGFNRVTTVGIRSLMKKIPECNSLKKLGLSGIPVDQNASKALAVALAYNTSLTTLNLDSCCMGYSAQRHIVAGIISNMRVGLRVLTGFPIASIAMTLGIPRLPDCWSNVQVLGFVRLMWQQWLLKSGHGRIPNAPEIRGPAPPAAVASAAKIALSSLGANPDDLFRAETHDIPFAEGPPIDPAGAALLERTDSGTLNIPSFSSDAGQELHEWIEEVNNHSPAAEGSPAAIAVSPLEDPVRRNENLKWLRTHFRSLSEVGRLPFHNADLWQLHQYYFSPPTVEGDDEEDDDENQAQTPDNSGHLFVPQNSPVHSSDANSLGRSVSFTTLGAALAMDGLNSTFNSHKRTHDTDESGEPLSKRAKCLKPRIAFYPRIMTKIQSLGTRPMDQTLSLLRQLKYMENVFFAGRNPYERPNAKDPTHQDIEMILLDLL